VADENLNRVFVLDGMTLGYHLPASCGSHPRACRYFLPTAMAGGHESKKRGSYVYDLDNTSMTPRTAYTGIHLGPAPGACGTG